PQLTGRRVQVHRLVAFGIDRPQTTSSGRPTMLRSFQLVLKSALSAITLFAPAVAHCAEDAKEPAIQEEIWALPVAHPTLAYVVPPVGKGPFPLVVMNHGVSLNARERSFFPLVEFRDAAMWFARHGNIVVAPTGPGYGAAALDTPERGLFSVFYSKIG